MLLTKYLYFTTSYDLGVGVATRTRQKGVEFGCCFDLYLVGFLFVELNPNWYKRGINLTFLHKFVPLKMKQSRLWRVSNYLCHARTILAASLRADIYERYVPSVRLFVFPSVCPFVRLSHTFDYGCDIRTRRYSQGRCSCPRGLSPTCRGNSSLIDLKRGGGDRDVAPPPENNR